MAQAEGDLESGTRLHLTRVVASRDVLIMENSYENPPDDPFRCPPAITWVVSSAATRSSAPTMATKHERRRIALAFGLSLFMMLGFAPAAVSADAGEHAGCVGLEIRFNTPPGSSEEFSGGGREVVEEVHSIAAALGIPPGAVVSFVARFHEGSHGLR